MLEVQGHTDDQGSDDYNLKLSQRRAETVVAYLGLFDIDTNRLVPKGYGEFKPVMPNTTEEERAKNRRVELVKR
jgi:OmpA-OmpF porin, OOP family